MGTSDNFDILLSVMATCLLLTICIFSLDSIKTDKAVVPADKS